MAAGSAARLGPAAAANAPTAAPVRSPSPSIFASRAASAPVALPLALFLEVPPIYLIAIAILAGDALGVNHLAVPLWIAASIAAAAALLFMRRNAAAATGVALLAIAAGASMPAREAVAPHYPPDSVRHFADGASVVLEGQINQASQQFPDREYVFVEVERAGASASAVKPASGNVRLTIVGAPVPVHLGDEVEVAGALRFARNFGDPGEFDYEGYLAREGIAATMVLGATAHARLAILGHRSRFPASDFAAIRARIGAFIDTNLAGEQRAEMRALMIGDRGGISQALRQRFALTGLAHMLVISGLHLGFVAAAAFSVVRLLMMFFPTRTALGYANKAAACAAALAASAYAAIAMPHVSTARALVMVLAYALAVIADGARALLASLVLAAILICLAMPGSTADIGFQLSFASVLAIVLGMRRFAPWWRRRFSSPDSDHMPSLLPRIAAAIAGHVAVSFWALLGVAPLTAYHFNQFSTVGVIANSIVVPVMALGGVVCGLAACAIGLTGSTNLQRACCSPAISRLLPSGSCLRGRRPRCSLRRCSKAPHHGSRTSSSGAFVAAVRPQVVVLSLGYRNSFAFPAPEVVARYLAAGARVLRTDQSGAVSVGLDPGAPILVQAYNSRGVGSIPGVMKAGPRQFEAVGLAGR